MADGRTRRAKRQAQRAQELEVQAFLRGLNDVKDHVAETCAPFAAFNRNGVEAVIRFVWSPDLTPELQQWAFDLVKSQMQAYYEACDAIGGWYDRGKREELFDDNARFLIAFSSDGAPLAFVNFRFDTDYGRKVVYCYELQVEPHCQRKGLGRHLMVMLELMGRKLGLEYLVLTVFDANEAAVRLYTQALKYKLDETSPPINLGGGPGYKIFSKPLCPPAAAASS